MILRPPCANCSRILRARQLMATDTAAAGQAGCITAVHICLRQRGHVCTSWQSSSYLVIELFEGWHAEAWGLARDRHATFCCLGGCSGGLFACCFVAGMRRLRGCGRLRRKAQLALPLRQHLLALLLQLHAHPKDLPPQRWTISVSVPHRKRCVPSTP